MVYVNNVYKISMYFIGYGFGIFLNIGIRCFFLFFWGKFLIDRFLGKEWED